MHIVNFYFYLNVIFFLYNSILFQFYLEFCACAVMYCQFLFEMKCYSYENFLFVVLHVPNFRNFVFPSFKGFFELGCHIICNPVFVKQKYTKILFEYYVITSS